MDRGVAEASRASKGGSGALPLTKDKIQWYKVTALVPKRSFPETCKSESYRNLMLNYFTAKKIQYPKVLPVLTI